MSPDDPDSPRLQRALIALDGLSVGDAVGERCFALTTAMRDAVEEGGYLPAGRWRYTDDTVMAMGIVEVLRRARRIDQDDLAETFARRFVEEPSRGYGGGAQAILSAIADGLRWINVSALAFNGEGSFGNGSAMRAAPLGAWFADDVERLVVEARRSAEVTHAHAEGIAGAVAAACAAAFAWNHRGQSTGTGLIAFAAERTAPGPTRDGLHMALEIPLDTPTRQAARQLGNGSEVSAMDTVPFALWCASRHFGKYETAIRSVIPAGGDIDTNCAIVGGIVALSAEGRGIPDAWLAAREAPRLD